MTETDFMIRRFKAEDTATLSRIWRQASAQAHPFFTAAQLDGQQEQVEQIYLPQAETWVALSGDVPLGFIGLLPMEEGTDHGAFVGGVFVAPEAQGQGIGRALIAHALSLTSHLTLEVYAANTSARAFYAKLGFRQIGQRAMDDHGLPYPLVKIVL